MRVTSEPTGNVTHVREEDTKPSSSGKGLGMEGRAPDGSIVPPHGEPDTK